MGPVREMLAASQMSEQKWRVLRVADEIGPAEQTRIAQMACLLLPSLTRILRAMEAEGLVTRTPGEVDRRQSIVAITRAGQDRIAEHAAESTAHFDRLEAEFGTEKMENLLDLLEELQEIPMK